MDGGQWGVDNGQWGVEDGGWGLTLSLWTKSRLHILSGFPEMPSTTVGETLGGPSLSRSLIAPETKTTEAGRGGERACRMAKGGGVGAGGGETWRGRWGVGGIRQYSIPVRMI